MTSSQSPAVRTSPRKRPSIHGTPKTQVLGRQTIAKPNQNSKAKEDSTKSRKAPRCTKCPEHPLRSQCAHTKVGREYLQQRALEQQVASFATSSDASIPLPNQQAENPRTGFGGLALSAAVSSPATAELRSIPNIQPVEQSNVRLNAHVVRAAATGAPESTSTGFFSPGPAQSAPTNSAPYVLSSVVHLSSRSIAQPVTTTTGTQPHAFPAAFNRSSTPVTPTPQRLPQAYDPVLMGLTHEATPQSTQSRASSPPCASTPSSDMEDDTPSPAKGSQTSHKRSKPTAANPFHGTVPGAMRGSSQQYNIFRTHKLPKAIIESKAASKKFREGVNCIIRKCEALSAQTGCWLFIGAQHAAASGGAIHYASPRLRRDAVTETEGIATQFLQLIKQVTESKRVDTLELQRNLDRTQERNNALEDRVHELQVKAREDMEKHQCDAELIREYSQRLGIVVSSN